MYGTIARVKLKAGGLSQLQALSDKIVGDARMRQNGHLATYLYQMDNNPDEIFLVVVWQNKELYFQNANSPEQNQEFMQMSQFFAEPPQWHDGEIVWSYNSLLK